MSVGRSVLVVVGAITAVVAAGLIAAGGGVLFASSAGRDADGFFTSPDFEITAAGHAVTADDIDLGSQPADWAPEPGSVRLRVTAQALSERAVFVGVGPDAAVDAYLEGVAHDRVIQLGESPAEVQTTEVPGDVQPAPPGLQDFWVASAEGFGPQTATWDVTGGQWRLVVMNADGAAGVQATTSAGVDVAFLPWVGLGILIAGLVLGGIAATLLVLGAIGGPRVAPAVIAPGGDGRTYPLALRGELDPQLSRWRWLVKWLLAIPHGILLGFLWIGFAVLTFVAWIAILLTGRYPRALFDYNVGVLRWTWRVTYYAVGVMGTDRYPPFSLQSDPSYPADLDIAYPERLSRGLALVKWLLAIPHLIIVGLLTGSGISWSFQSTNASGGNVGDGGGIMTVLMLVVGVILLVSGTYPRGLYDVVMGLQRWIYRTTAYVALMTDAYPPFRLDTGGAEPGTEPVQPLPPPPPSPSQAAPEVQSRLG